MKSIFTQKKANRITERFRTFFFLLTLPLLFSVSGKAQINYVEFACSDTYVSIVGVAGTTLLGSGDDAIFANVPIPFTMNVYGTGYTLCNVGTNGFVVLMPGGANRGLGNTTLPTATAGACLYPFWDDLDINPATGGADAGVYVRVDGVAPNQIFTIEWNNAGHFPDAANQTINFQVRLFQTGRIQFKYFDTVFGGGQAAFDNGLSATVGLEGPLPAPRPFTLHSFNAAGVMSGQCIEFVAPMGCNLVVGSALQVTNSPGTCSATAIVPVPATTPSGCADGQINGIRYRLNNAGPYINVPLPAATVTIPNIPGGVNTINWQTYLIANGATLNSADQQITVIDTEAPVVHCPADINHILLPGQCAASIGYTVTASDNCPFMGPANTLVSNPGADNNQNSPGGTVFFDLENGFSGNMTITGMATKILGPTIVNVFIKSGTGLGFEQNFGAWTFVGAGDATGGPFSPSLTPFAINFQIPPGTTGVCLQMVSTNSRYTNGTGVSGAYGNSPNGTFTDGTLTIRGGATSNTFFGSAPFNPRIWNGSVSYFTASGGEIIQTAGLPSGSEFPIGTTINCFVVSDAQGNSGTCCFGVTVSEYPNPTTNLTCNDGVQVSLNEDCTGIIFADMILEGGPYRCYDNYIVELDKTEPLGNGPWVPAVLGPNDAGHTYVARVTDPVTGNSCWGYVSVEDKIPPTIECRDLNIMCGAQLPDEPAPGVQGVQQFLYTGLNDPINDVTAPLVEYDFDLSYLPPGTPALDVNVFANLTHTFMGDVDIFVIAPSGAMQAVFQVTGCGGTFPINAWFDDEGLPPVDCNDLDANGGRIWPITNSVPGPALFTLDGEDASGIWTVRLTDNVGLDGGTIFGVGLEVEVNLPPVAPQDNCGEVTLSHTDTQSGDPCEGLVVTRHWIATDESGNTAACDQHITVNPLVLDSVTCPPAYIGHCGDASSPEYTGWPTVNGEPITDENNVCNIFVGYWDKPLNDCGNGEKIIRTWTILDWCTQTSLECIQVLKFSDDEAPEITCPSNIEVGTDFWYCYANVSVPKPNVYDACGSLYTLSLTSTGGHITNFNNNYVINQLPLGTHTATWTAEDECGNKSSCSFTITVVDDVVPVANCDEHTIVSLTNDGPYGITLVPADVFDDGSYDNCGPVTFRARRMDSCIDFDWTTEGACIDDVPGGIPPVNSRDRGTVARPCVPFACCDVGAGPIMVELEVTDAAGNRNFCMVEAEVQDKISPFVECPPDIIVSCDFWFNVQEGTFEDKAPAGNGNGNLDEDPLSAVFGNMYDAFQYNDDQSFRGDIIINDPGNENYSQPHFWGIEGWADDNCEVNLQVRVRVVSDCSGGDLPGNAPPGAVKMVERRFSASDGNNGVAPGTCTQRIWVVDFDPFYIEDSTCNNNDPNDGVIWPCDVLLTNCPEDLGNTGAPTLFDDACSLIGVTYEDTRFDFVDGACFKILREWSVIDWCQYNSQTGEGLWHYIQVIKVHDEQGPEFTDCPAGPVTLCVGNPEGVTLPDNNQAFLGEDDPLSTSCSARLRLSQVVHETCSDYVNYDVKLYLNNGTDFIYLKTTTTVEVDSSNDAELTIDSRQSPNQAISKNGVPYNSPWCGDYHRILWSAEDGCGNWSHCEYLIRLEDCKQPSPVCINGLSTVVMPVGGQVTVWAKDFNASSFDDCTPSEELLYSFSGDSYTPSFTYTCDNVVQFNAEISIQIWVADGGTDDNCNGQISWNERNKDYCTTTIVITDNAHVCGDTTGPIVGGVIMTEDIQSVELVNVSMTSPGQVFPTYVTATNGKYDFQNIILHHDAEISSVRNDNYRNGVSTLDLVKIQKHLLGIELLSSPYDIIAADANNSGSVSAIDLIELRKLILGIYTALPNNQSWRFADHNFQFTNPASPWPFDETINLTDVTEDMMDNDFVAIKIGDVNNSVKANAQQILPRSGNGVLHFSADDRNVSAGEKVELAIRSNDFTGIEGYQFTLQTKGLSFDGIERGIVDMTDDNIGVFPEMLTASWHKAGGMNATSEEVLFTLHFTAIREGRLSEMIHLNSLETQAEAYNTSDDIKDLRLSFRGHGTEATFALYQNEPNPFKGNTLIGYDMPEAGPVTLTVFDLTGKVLTVADAEAVKGYNTIVISSKNLPAAGVMYYRLDAGEYTATKKMVIVE